MIPSELAAWSLLALGVVAVGLVANALAPVRRPDPLAIPSFFAAWLTGDLPVVHGVMYGLGAAVAVGLGGLDRGVGLVGLALVSVALVGLVWVWRDSGRAAGRVDEALAQAGIEPVEAPPARVRDVLRPFHVRRRNVQRTWRVTYATVGRRRLHLDIYRSANAGADAPVLLFVHGGAWVIAFRDRQARPLLERLAERGWVCVSAGYRLSPGATFPDHLIDVKRAIAWIRANIHSYGGNPEFLAIHGNSAGAHLASLAALTANNRVYQPGFETVDTSVVGCVPVYGPYDLTDRFGHWRFKQMGLFMRYVVMKCDPVRDREAYEAASPLCQIHEAAPPFFVVHGSSDSLVPVDEGRRFTAALRQQGVRCAYAEIPGGQHALDVFVSRRSLAVVAGIERFLEDLRRRA